MHNETPPVGREYGEALSSSTLSRPSAIKIIIRPVSVGSRGQNYSVPLDGAVIIASSRCPTGDACRYLVVLGRIGRLEIWDDTRRYTLLIIADIARAAALAVNENDRHGQRFVAYKARAEFTKEAA